MSSNREKQNIRVQKVCERLNKKVSYNGFNQEEIKIIKLRQKYDQLQKDLSSFWRYAPRLENGSVDWNNMDDKELDYFEYINEEAEKTQNKLSKLDDKGLDIEKIMYMFMLGNVHSVSF